MVWLLRSNESFLYTPANWPVAVEEAGGEKPAPISNKQTNMMQVTPVAGLLQPGLQCGLDYL